METEKEYYLKQENTMECVESQELGGIFPSIVQLPGYK